MNRRRRDVLPARLGVLVRGLLAVRGGIALYLCRLGVEHNGRRHVPGDLDPLDARQGSVISGVRSSSTGAAGSA